MDERRYHLPDQQNHFISGNAMEKLLRRADANAGLMYLYILQQEGKISVEGAVAALRLSEDAVYDALAVLASLGLVSGSAAKTQREQRREMPDVEELPQYTAAEIEREMGADKAFASLVKEVSAVLGKILTAPDLNILMGLVRSLGLPPEVVYQLVCHLTKEHRDRYGAGKCPTMRGIEKIAYYWARDGIVTLDLAMAHIDRRAQQQSQIGRMKVVMDLRQDKLTPTQEKYMFDWLGMGFDVEVIASAYDKTVVATGGLKWNYMHAILKNWHEKGLHTQEDIDKGDGRKGQVKRPKAELSNAPDRDEIARKRKLLDQMNGQ